jgi:hypothetical protein
MEDFTMAKTRIYNTGGFDLKAKKSSNYFWDIPDKFVKGTWTVTAWPDATLDDPANPEQRVEVTNLFLLRKGPGTNANGLQLNFKINNLSNHPVKGFIMISGILE